MQYVYLSRATKRSVCALTAAVGLVAASSDFNNHNHNVNFSPDYQSPYLYSEIRSVELSSDDENDVPYLPNQDQSTEETEFSEDVSSDEASSSSLVSSSLLYDGGCYVSSQAIMCNGGGGISGPENSNLCPPTPTSSATTADLLSDVSEAVLQHLLDDELFNELLEDDDQDDEENDDDDDDDGHSSMLSNASLKRSKSGRRTPCYAGGSARSSSSTTYNDHQTTYLEGEVKLNNKKQRRRPLPFRRQQSTTPFLMQQVFQIRGGSTAAVGSELTKKLINSAVVTLLFEGCMGHILEFFKIVMQTSPPGTSYGKVFKDITSEKGITGLWDGFIPWGVIQAVVKGGVFGLAYEAALKVLMPLTDDGKIPTKLAMTLAGGIAGGFQGYVLSPTLLMKTRVMTNEVFRESMSLLQTTWKSLVIGGDIIKHEGLGSLMKGANTFATKRVFDWASRYFFADLFESLFLHLKGSSLSVTEKIIASLLGGVASTILTLPLDVLVAKTQDAKKAGVKVSVWKLFSDELKEEGWAGLRNNYMKGFEARLLHVCLTTVVMKTMAPISYRFLFDGKA
eukprot:CAMPEP_0178744890 /NCGR_PEP_ID=MMETSP0744-20121128/7011_1 /TAXON_ID=913974 /ORGANISM="Nitzschia punctata, Strain CCMP561" /LENGTH=564 /DNA_ID=CAMNT_0020398053 /DNA_START=13 /DNA_END=1707 /DNA_ORIENTATION=+